MSLPIPVDKLRLENFSGDARIRVCSDLSSQRDLDVTWHPLSMAYPVPRRNRAKEALLSLPCSLNYLSAGWSAHGPTHVVFHGENLFF